MPSAPAICFRYMHLLLHFFIVLSYNRKIPRGILPNGFLAAYLRSQKDYLITEQ